MERITKEITLYESAYAFVSSSFLFTIKATLAPHKKKKKKKKKIAPAGFTGAKTFLHMSDSDNNN